MENCTTESLHKALSQSLRAVKALEYDDKDKNTFNYVLATFKTIESN